MSNNEQPIHKHRRDNLRVLAAAFSSRSAFATHLDKDPGVISRLIGKNFSQTIGDNTARLVERTFDKEVGWMDQDHSIKPAVQLINVDVLTQVIEIYGIYNKQELNLNVKAIAKMYDLVMSMSDDEEQNTVTSAEVIPFKELKVLATKGNK